MEDILVPFFALAVPVAIVLIVHVFDSKHKERIHKERMLAMEKGIEVPKFEERSKTPGHIQARNAGIIITALGLGAFVPAYVNAGWKPALGTLVIILLGLAFLAISVLSKKDTEK